jgi:hypothetical protein
MKTKIEEEWARCLIGQLLADIHTQADKKRILDMAQRSALGVRPDLMKVLKELVEMKERAGLITSD